MKISEDEIDDILEEIKKEFNKELTQIKSNSYAAALDSTYAIIIRYELMENQGKHGALEQIRNRIKSRIIEKENRELNK